MRLVTVCLSGLMLASPLAAQEPAPRETPQREHTVKTGDTLWDLAGFYYSNPWQWPTIYQANTMVVEDPHWIYPQEVLIIPGFRADVGPTEVAIPAPGLGSQPAAPRRSPLRTIFYREPPPPPQGDEPMILSEAGMRELPVKPGQFSSAEFLADPDRLTVYGRMIRTLRNEGDMNDMPTSAHPQDIIFLSYGEAARADVGDRLLMVRVGDRVRSAGPESRIIHPTAVVRVESLAPEVMRVRVEDQFEPVIERQAAVPLDMFPDFLAPRAEPIPGGGDLDAQLLAWATEQQIYMKTDHAFINVGRQHGVQVGDVFMAYLPEREARAGRLGQYRPYAQQLPPEAVAELLVIRVMESSATVQVEQLLLPMLEEGIRVRRIRRMP